MALDQNKLNLYIADHLWVILVCLLLVTAFGGYVTYATHVDPGTEMTQIEESSWSSSGEYEHSGIVETDSTVFDAGTVLENQPAYMTAITPVLNGTYKYEYDASESGDLSVTVDTVRVLRAVDEADTFEYWRDESRLSSTSVDSLVPGEQIAAPFRFNISETRDRITTINSELQGSPGEIEIRVESRVRISGERNGHEVDDTQVHAIDIDDRGSVYRVETDGSLSNSDQETRQEPVAPSYTPIRSIGTPLLFLASLMGVVGLAVGVRQNRFDISDSEREWLAYRAALAEFDEWISTGAIPDRALDTTTVEVKTLEGLVDVAIDSDRRVIRDPNRNLCAVLLEETVYTYGQPANPFDSSHSQSSMDTNQSEDCDDENDTGLDTTESGD